MKSSPPRPAIYHAPEAVFHADTCDRLKLAAERGEVRLAGFGRRGYPGQMLPKGMLPEVASVGVWDAPTGQSWGLDWHRNEGLELTFLARGQLSFALQDETFQLKNGQITLTRPWQKHRVGNPFIQASRLHWVILDLGVRRPDEPWKWPKWMVFSPRDQTRLTELLRHCEAPVWNASPAIHDDFERIATQLEAGEPAAAETQLRILLNSVFYELLQILEVRAMPLQPSLTSTRRVVELFLQTLPEHLDHPWTLDTMAEHCGLGRSRFAHYCEAITNLSPAKYLMRCRLDHALRLLRDSSGRTVTEIALESGFLSSQYFANVFRKAHGITPTQAQREAAGCPPSRRPL